MRIILSLLLLITIHTTASAKIIESHNISDIKNSYETNTLVLFDVDETLMDSDTHLNSGKWYDFFWKGHALTTSEVEDTATGDLMWFIAEKVPTSCIEPEILDIINELQSSEDMYTLGLTARHPGLTLKTKENLTAKQLKTIGIDFSKSKSNSLHDHDLFFDGIFFTSGKLKGPVLVDILTRSEYRPNKIIFVDDRLKQIQSVDLAMQEMGIPCDCYWYRRAHIERPHLDEISAVIQLDHIICHDILLDDEEAHALKESYADTTFSDIFDKVLNHFKDYHLNSP